MERGGVNRKTLVLEEFITSSLPKKKMACMYEIQEQAKLELKV